jgi:hypothetical protein
MLVDPMGKRTISCRSPDPADKGKMVDVLVEIAPPVESADEAYTINGIFVTDLSHLRITMYREAREPNTTLRGSVKKPLSVLKGGYLSWGGPKGAKGYEWHQEIWFDGDSSQFRNLGKLN